MKLEDRLLRSIANRSGVVVLRSELTTLGSAAQLSRALRALIARGKLVRVSKGAFVKTRLNQVTGQPAPASTLEAIAAELFKKLRVDLQPSQLVREYNKGASTQIPMVAVVNTGRRKISRKVIVGGRSLEYENSNSRMKMPIDSIELMGLNVHR